MPVFLFAPTYIQRGIGGTRYGASISFATAGGVMTVSFPSPSRRGAWRNAVRTSHVAMHQSCCTASQFIARIAIVSSRPALSFPFCHFSFHFTHCHHSCDPTLTLCSLILFTHIHGLSGKWGYTEMIHLPNYRSTIGSQGSVQMPRRGSYPSRMHQNHSSNPPRLGVWRFR